MERIFFLFYIIRFQFACNCTLDGSAAVRCWGGRGGTLMNAGMPVAPPPRHGQGAAAGCCPTPVTGPVHLPRHLSPHRPPLGPRCAPRRQHSAGRHFIRRRSSAEHFKSFPSRRQRVDLNLLLKVQGNIHLTRPRNLPPTAYHSPTSPPPPFVFLSTTILILVPQC